MRSIRDVVSTVESSIMQSVLMQFSNNATVLGVDGLGSYLNRRFLYNVYCIAI